MASRGCWWAVEPARLDPPARRATVAGQCHVLYGAGDAEGVLGVGGLDRVEVAGLAVVYEHVTQQITTPSGSSLHQPTRCAGWSRQDLLFHLLLFHLLLDAQRALVALARPVGTDADTDSVGYWRALGAEGSALGHAEYVRRAAAAYDGAASLVAQWVDTSAAAISALRRAEGSANELTQGKVLRLRDFGETLVLEAALHLLDLTPSSDEWPVPSPVSSAVRRTLVALLDSPVPDHWDDRAVALRLGGREPLTAQLRHELGPAAAKVPVLR